VIADKDTLHYYTSLYNVSTQIGFKVFSLSSIVSTGTHKIKQDNVTN